VKDFSSFANEKDEYETCERTVVSLIVSEHNSNIIITIEGTGFLRKMVRNIVGFMVEIGKGTRSLSSVHEVFRQRDRKSIGMPAPARGLYLWKVKYPNTYFMHERKKEKVTSLNTKLKRSFLLPIFVFLLLTFDFI
jgi:tRNA pseudouridine38-40 synthase